MSEQRYAGMERPGWLWLAPVLVFVLVVLALQFGPRATWSFALGLGVWTPIWSVILLRWEREAAESRKEWERRYESLDALQQRRRVNLYLAHLPPPSEPWRN